MLLPASRYAIPTMPGLRITVDSGGGELERLVGGEWQGVAAVPGGPDALDELLRYVPALEGVRREDLIEENRQP